MDNNNNIKYILIISFLFIISFISPEFLKAIDEDNKPVIGFLPFDHTFETGSTKAGILSDSIENNMIRYNLFDAISIENWASQKYYSSKACDIYEILEAARVDNLPVDYICHGMIFKSGDKYGLIAALYPLDYNISPTYYFRTFSVFSRVKKAAYEIVFEMAKRAGKNRSTLFDKTIVIENFNISLCGINNPFVKNNTVKYHTNDNFLNELFLYNFHVNGIFNVKTNNMQKYISKNSGVYYDADYILSGHVNISKKTATLSLYLKYYSNENLFNKSGDIIYYKQYHINNLDADNLYNLTRKYTKHIIYTILNPLEQGKTCEIQLESHYGRDKFLLDDCYLGKGNLDDLILPVTEKIEIENYFSNKWSLFTGINIAPGKITKIKRPFFNISIGGSIYYRMSFHPLYYDDISIRLAGKNYDLLEINKKMNINQFFSYANISNQIGPGAELFLEAKYFGVSTNICILFAEYYRRLTINSDDKLNFRQGNIKKYQSEYIIKKLSVITEFNVLPCFILLPYDSPIRIFGGLGIFIAFWYNYFYDILLVNAVIGEDKKSSVQENNNYQSLFLNLGITPELGIIIKYTKFNFKWSIAYNFDLIKYIIFSDIDTNSIFNSYKTNTFQVKFTLGYYIN